MIDCVRPPFTDGGATKVTFLELHAIFTQFQGVSASGCVRVAVLCFNTRQAHSSTWSGLSVMRESVLVRLTC